MKKISFLLSLLALLISTSAVKSQAFNFTVTPQVICNANNGNAMAGITSTAAGATHYTWTVSSPGTSCTPSYSAASPGLSAWIYYPCPGVYTITCFAYNGSNFLSSVSMTTAVMQTMSMGYNGNSALCAGGSATITFNNQGSYTWTPSNNVTGSVAVLSPTATTVYTVGINNGNGCISYSTVPIVVHTLPTVSISGAPNGTFCAGSFISGVGASNYTWQPGNIVSTNFYANSVTPGCYTVTGGNTCGTDTAVICITPVAAPALTITGNNPTCAFNSLTISASGATNYSWTGPPNYGWMQFNSTSPIVVITPTATGNYFFTLTANISGFCPIYTTVVVSSGASAYITTTDNTFGCNGTHTLTASGGTSYTWSIGTNTIATGASMIVTPTVNTCYTVTGSPSGTATCPGFATRCVTVSTPPSVSIMGSPTVCSGWNGQWLWATGMSTYTWYPGNIVSSAVPAPTANTCYTVIGTTVPGCTASAVQCVTVVPTTPFSITGNTNICVGATATFTGSGATTYTWAYHNGNNNVYQTGPFFSHTPSSSIMFTVNAHNSMGCSNYTNVWINVVPSPTISVSGNSFICPGQTTTLTASGLNTYSWSNSVTGSQIIVTPSITTCYNVTGVGSSGCNGFFTQCVTILPAPAVSIAGNNSICVGSNIILAASGASTYAWSNSASTSSLTVAPSSNTCYSVTGTNSFGCTGTAVKCVTVHATNISISPTNPTVCLGSSVNFTASGANTYTWNTLATTSTLNALTTTPAQYSVAGIGANGCYGAAIVAVAVDTTCSDVWPGDANSDGIVSSSDVLEIGLAFSSTGSARTPGGNAYTAQFANNWSGTVSTGKNKVHADCNGDGAVNFSDTVAITNNFALSHAFRPSQQSGDDISIVADGNVAFTGQWNKADVILGSPSNIISLYGLTFDIGIDQTQLEPNSAYIVYTPSFLNAANQNVEFRKAMLSADKIYAASVRTDMNDVGGEGKIAEIWFKLKSDADLNSRVELAITSSGKINKNGVGTVLSSGGASIDISEYIVGLKQNTFNEKLVQVYPNPAKDVLYMRSENLEKVSFTINNLLGQKLMTGSFSGDTTLDISSLSHGSYLVTLTTASGTTHKKIVIE